MWQRQVDDVVAAYRALDNTSWERRNFRRLPSGFATEDAALRWLNEGEEPGYYISRIRVIIYRLLRLLLLAISLRLCDLFVNAKTARFIFDSATAWAPAFLTQTRSWELPMLEFLVAISRVASGSALNFSRLVSCWLWIQSVCTPFVRYGQKEISDHQQIRLFLVGVFFSGYFSIVSEAMGHCDSLGDFLVASSGAVVPLLIKRLVMDPREPWIWIRHRPTVAKGTVVERRVALFVEQTVLVATKMMLLYTNRTLKWLATLACQPRNTRSARTHTPPNNRYEYSPLQGAQVRILKLCPGLSHESIRCRIEAVTLDGSPAFDAVSYVWGSDERNRVVLVDDGGKEMRLDVTDSAFSVLAALRSRWHERVLWIDGVCINQDDNTEKATQVRLMGEIYSTARRVVAWLGPSGTAPLVQHLLAELRYLRIGWGLSYELVKSVTNDFFGPRWPALAEFFQNPWFTRNWIIQEAALSRELHFFYGDTCIDWEVVRQSLHILMKRDVQSNFPTIINGSFSGRNLRKVGEGLANADAITEFRGDSDFSGHVTLETALSGALGFSCGNPRDKIYSLLSLTQPTGLTVDYDGNPRDLFIKAMSEILSHTTTLDALHHAGICGPKLIPDLPSWVPDWNVKSFTGLYKSMHNAATDQAAVVTLVEGDPTRVISVEGWERDSVELVGDPLEIADDTALEDACKIFRDWHQVSKNMARDHAVFYPKGARLEVYVRTAVGDRISDSLPGKPPAAEQCLEMWEAVQQYYSGFEEAHHANLGLRHEYGKSLQGWAAWTREFMAPGVHQRVVVTLTSVIGAITNPEHQATMRRLEEIVDRATVNALVAAPFLAFSRHLNRNRFCITKHGRMAVIPAESKPGDLICVMKGAAMPFLLRRTVEAQDTQEEYQLVACCYVQGLMERGYTGAAAPARPFLLV